MTIHRTTIPRNPDREGWLAQRAPYVGASEIAALFDEHPYLELGDLAAEKIDGGTREQTPAMYRGIVLEAAVADWWAAEHELEIEEVGELYVAGGSVMATLDRRILGHEAALEVKTTAKRLSEPERYWWWQAQAQLACTGYERIELAVLDGSMLLTSYTILPDLDAQHDLLDRAARFLEHVAEGRIPPGAAVSKDGIRRLYPDPTEESIELVAVVNANGRTLDPRIVLRSLKTAKARLKREEHEVAKLEGILRTQLRNAERGTIDGKLAVTLKVEHYRDLDVKRLREELPEIAAKFDAARTRRRMLLK